MSRNPYQQQTDWYGLYPMDASTDPVLFPRVRQKTERWRVTNRSDAPVVLRGAGRQQTLKVGTHTYLGTLDTWAEYQSFAETADLPVVIERQQLGLLEVESEGRMDSVAHPAKMSLPLLRKILSTMQEFGWLHAGGLVVDPFGGRMSTGLVWCAQAPENRSVCIELEPHFVAMGKQNLAHAERLLGRKLNLTIIQGDSRKADKHLRELGVGVSSPPYEDSLNSSTHGIDWGKAGKWKGGRRRGEGTTHEATLRASLNYHHASGHTAGYHNIPGNIDNLPDEPSVCVSSQPYEQSLASDDPEKRGGLFRDPRRANDRTLTGTYCAVGSQPFEAQSGGHKDYEDGALDSGVLQRHSASRIAADAGYSACGSPPFEASLGSQDPDFVSPGEMECHAQERRTPIDYGASEAQIGSTQGETYADACRDVYSALARAGVRYVALVTKNPTRAGRLRRLDQLTCRLLRQAGYRVVAWRRAWLYHTQAEVEALTGQARLDVEAGESKRIRGRVSFFRRLHLKRGGVAAAWEDVIFAELVKAECRETGVPEPVPAGPWLAPWQSTGADPHPGDTVCFAGQDGTAIDAVVNMRDGAALLVSATMKKKPLTWRFDGQWPRTLEVVNEEPR